MKRLGEILTELEWVSPAGLARALATQEILGGRLGTCMLEVEAVSEERLMAGLVRQLQVPAVRTRDLTSIPSEVLEFFPETLAVESQAVPFRMLGDQLHVAMLDVHDRVLLQQLSERCDKTIVPHIANEARLFKALGDGYGCAVSERFRQLVRQLEDGVPVPEPANGHSPAETNGAGIPTEGERDDDDLESAVRDIAQLAQALAAATDRETIASLVLTYLDKRYRACALFVCRRDEFRGWRGTGADFDARRLAELHLPSSTRSVLAHLRDGVRYHAGPLTPNDAHRKIAEVWSSDVPRDALVVPVHVAGRLALAIWCVPTEAGTLDAAAVEEAQQVAELTGDALARLIATQRQSGATSGA